MEIKPVDPEFVRVWSRVTARPPEEVPPAVDSAFLAGKLRAEQERLRTYRALGLDAPARVCAQRARGLRTALFFAGAQPQTAAGAPNRYSNRTQALRQLYLAEGASERDYRAAAQQSDDVMLARLYHTCADGCAKVRQYLWQLVEGK